MKLLQSDFKKINETMKTIGVSPLGTVKKTTRKFLINLYRSCLIKGNSEIEIAPKEWNTLYAPIKDKMISKNIVKQIDNDTYQIPFVDISGRKWKYDTLRDNRKKCFNMDKYKGDGMVYLIICRNFVKIGYTARSVVERLMGLQVGSPYELSLWGTVGDINESFEHKLHQRYSAFRVRGEWFEIEVLSYITKDIPIAYISR